MKKVAALLVGILFLSFSAKAASNAEAESTLNYYDGKSYIFVENGVEFSVFPDGQFDFVYVGRNNGGNVNVNVVTPGVNVSFNAGHDYDTYVQYDDYGAVIQIENVPVYYDDYGRIIQAGDVEIRYTNRRIVRVGGLFINYNRFGAFDYCTGFINPWNRFYVYRPWHVFYARPLFANCIVYDYGYRRYYRPLRYSFANHRRYYANRGRVAYTNGRRDFYRPGSRVHYKNGRSAVNRDYKPNRRNTAISNTGRRDNAVSRGTNRGIASNNARPTSRGISRTDNNARTDRPNSRGISKGTNSVSKGRPSSRGISKGTSTVRKDRPSSQRGVAKRSGSSSVNRGTARQTRSKTVSRSGNKKRNSVSRPTQKRSTASRKSKSVSRSNRASAPRRATAQRSNPSRSKGSVSRGGGSRAKSSAPRRGRGRS